MSASKSLNLLDWTRLGAPVRCQALYALCGSSSPGLPQSHLPVSILLCALGAGGLAHLGPLIFCSGIFPLLCWVVRLRAVGSGRFSGPALRPSATHIPVNPRAADPLPLNFF